MIRFALLKCCLFALASYAMATPKAMDRNTRDITDEIIYFLMTDRFENGDPSNDKGLTEEQRKNPNLDDPMVHGFLPSNHGFFHGGDLKGLIKRLPYIKNLGATAIWLTPVQKNQAVQGGGSIENSSAGYHGYWITDFTTIDPHLGTEEEFKSFVQEAHKLGLKVFIDVIVNHTADVIRYKECLDCSYRSVKDYPYSNDKINPGFDINDHSIENFAKLTNPNYAYTPVVNSSQVAIKKPAWLNDVLYYHNRGNSTFSGENAVLGDFFGLDDLFTEHPKVVDGMIDIYKEWISKYRIDGFRIDTVKHVNIEFWQKFVPAIQAHAKKEGIKNFFMFGEVFSGNPQVLNKYIKDGKLDSVLDFAGQGAIRDVIAKYTDKNKLDIVYEADDLYRETQNPNRLVTFISNHDIGRFGYFLNDAWDNKKSNEIKTKLSILAHAYLIFSRGVPVIYYGDEQGFTGDGGDKDARESMFPSIVDSYNDNNLLGTKKTTKDNNFDENHQIFRAIRQFSDIYKQHRTLRSGTQHNLKTLDQELFGFRRINQSSGEAYYVVFNRSNQPKVFNNSGIASHLLYPNKSAAAKSIKVPPLSFIIAKGSSKALQSQTIPKNTTIGSDETEKVSGFFPFEVKVPGEKLVTVDFYREIDYEYVHQFRDSNRPFIKYIDTAKLENGDDIHLKAIVSTISGKTKEFKKSFVVSRARPNLRFTYENGNKRNSYSYVESTGKTIVARPLDDQSSFELTWPADVDGIFISYSSTKPGKASEFDMPVYIDYKTQLAPIVSGKPKNGFYDVYITNEGKVSGKKQFTGGQKPVTISDSSKKAPFASTDIFLRGGMNSWNADNKMTYGGNHTFITRADLIAGTVEFKFADKDWTAKTNMGTPVSAEGLARFAGSQNLKIDIEKKDAGMHQFELVAVPGTKAGLKIFFKVSKL
ncbi:MAG: hypothetical protein HRU19_09895 [Pseudobacteriovorax sp.]|nr:hypothetical protein [Pseudobacteriovorax sp.]